MLSLELLERRCLLSTLGLVVTDGIDGDASNGMDFSELPGDVYVGQSIDSWLRIINQSGSTIKIDSLTFQGLDTSVFTLVDPGIGGGYILGDGEHIEVPVTFTPEELGFVGDTLTIDVEGRSGGSGTFSLDVDMTGVADGSVNLEMDNLQLSGVFAPNVVLAGQTLGVSGRILNNGPSDIPPIVPGNPLELQFYLSADTIWGNGNDTYLNAVEITTMPDPNGGIVAIPAGTTTTIPAGIDGDFYILAVIDGTDVVVESDETDNSVASFLLNVASFDGSVSVTDVNPNDPENVFNDNIVDFGDVTIGWHSDEAYITIQNTCVYDVEIDGLSIEDGDTGFILDMEGQQLPFVLSPLETTTVSVMFYPQDIGNVADVLEIDAKIYDGLGSREDVDVAILGNGLGGPAITVIEQSGTENDDKLEFDLLRAGMESDSVAFNITNTGDQLLQISAIDLLGEPNTPFAIDTDSWELPFNLEPGVALTVDVIFDPEAVGDFTDTISILSNLPNAHIVSVTGSAMDTVLTIEESAGTSNDNMMPFGFQSATAPQPITERLALVNNDSYPITVHGWSTALENVFVVSQVDPSLPDGGFVIDIGQSVLLDVTFLSAGQGLYEDTLTISSDGGDYEIALTGQAVNPEYQIRRPQGPVSGDVMIDLGETAINGYPNGDWFSIRNVSSVELLVSSIVVSGEGFSVSYPPLDTLQPQESIIIEVAFDATTQMSPGDYAGNVAVETTSPDPLVVNLFATAVVPMLEISETQLDFGLVGFWQSQGQGFQLHNNGTSDLTVSQWTIDDSQFTVDIDLPLVIAPDAAEFVTVTFTPTLRGQAVSQLILTSDDPSLPETTVVLTGSSLGAEIALSSAMPSMFSDADGNIVEVSLSSGQGSIYLDNGQYNGGNIALLELNQTGTDTRLKISTARGYTTTIDQMLVDGSLLSIEAPNVTINEMIDVNGSLERLQLNNIADNSVINVGQGANKAMSITANRIGQDVAFDLLGDVGVFNADSFQSGSLTAHSFKQVNITAGDLGANVSAFVGNIDRVLVCDDIIGNLEAKGDIGRIISTHGDISGNVLAESGNIKLVKAGDDLTGNVLAKHDIGMISAKNGVLSGTLRADNVKKIIANTLNDALVSVADRIANIKIKTDVINSHLLAGYDIGMDAMVGPGDEITGGDIGVIRFGGNLVNSHIAFGVAPVHSPLFAGQVGDSSSEQPSSAKVFGRGIVPDNNGQLFGIYYDDTVGHRALRTNLLQPSQDYVITLVSNEYI